MTTYEITTTTGRRVTRTTDATYVAASERVNGTVRFHKTHAAAKVAAGALDGTVSDHRPPPRAHHRHEGRYLERGLRRASPLPPFEVPYGR